MPWNHSFSFTLLVINCKNLQLIFQRSGTKHVSFIISILVVSNLHLK